MKLLNTLLMIFLLDLITSQPKNSTEKLLMKKGQKLVRNY